ncbi:MAG: AAA family ATPase [Synergistaceae bacterium]|jgi:MoxR-like ATPase|nr:AAA family ATPase [Synergistaceae bacterium]
MIRPQPLKQYSDIDLKLAIKSSFPNAKATLALLIMLWKASDRPSEISYSQADGGKIIVSDSLKEKLIRKYSPVYSTSAVSDDSFVTTVNGNQLFKSQLEPLLVGIELVWRIARLRFADGRQQGAERTGGERFPKILAYTCNIDVIDAVLTSDEDSYAKVLLKWIGCGVTADNEFESTLVRLLACLAESSFYRLEDGDKEVIFNPNSLYLTLLASEGSPVDIDGDVETKGSLRTLKSALSEGLNPYLSYSNGGSVSVSSLGDESLRAYQGRVDNYLHINVGTLQGVKRLIVAPESESGDDSSEVEDETPPFRRINKATRITGGANYLLYGVPGSGKSHTVKTEYCDDEERMERVVFHPDYTYSDFVGQIMPKLDEERRVYYDFSPGPFTRMLKKAYANPGREFFLVIEELNRGNAPAIFGEVFQLLDRKERAEEGTVGESSYGITNAYVAKIVYDDAEHQVLVPSNLNIVATMNTSDQNVFTLDTAFQRRWRMRMIENNIGASVHAKETILDTTVTWEQFNTAINKLILETNSRLSSSEDKRLGAYFATPLDLELSTSSDTKEADKQNSRFPEKVLKYLWDDAFKFSREVIFDIDNYQSLEEVIRTFKASSGNERFNKIFKESVLGDIGD